LIERRYWIFRHPPMVSEVSLSSSRAALIDALDLLSDRTLHSKWRSGEQTWPGLTEAVHWLIDDTWLDKRPAASLVPEVLTDSAEAAAVEAAVSSLLVVLDDLGSTCPDGQYLEHGGWPTVIETSASALALLSECDAG